VVQNGDSALVFEPLDVFWSPENRPVSGDDDYSDGEIGSTFYKSDNGASPKGIYVLGDDGVDTDAYDAHVLAHQFMHFIEYKIGRSDSIGGVHADGDKLDLRVAFSEGFGNAFSGMALGDSVYRDSNGASQGDGFDLDVEGNTWTNPGWFSEGSIGSIVWDLYDSRNDGADATSVPFSDMLDVERTELRNGPALTSLFVFVSALKTRPELTPPASTRSSRLSRSSRRRWTPTEARRRTMAASPRRCRSIRASPSTAAQSRSVAGQTTYSSTTPLAIGGSCDSASRRTVRGDPRRRTGGHDRFTVSGSDLILWKNGFLDASDCGGRARRAARSRRTRRCSTAHCRRGTTCSRFTTTAISIQRVASGRVPA
jgi:hypothetical protein